MTLKAAIIPVTEFQQNCTILWEEETRHAVVVDAGGDVDKLMDAIGQLGVTVERLLLTHGHMDHAGGAAELRERLAAAHPEAPRIPIEGPGEADGFLLAAIEKQAQLFGLRGLRSVVPDRFLTEGDTITLGDTKFDVVHCPGHTPGHIAFIDQTARVALVGDIIFAGSVGRTDLGYGSHAELINSITTKLIPLGDDITFVPGHGPTSTFGQERQSNPFLE